MNSTARNELHRIVDELPDNDIPTAQRLLRSLLGGKREFRFFDDAPMDDEPLTDEDIQAIAEAEEDIAAGRTQSLEDLRRELGL